MAQIPSYRLTIEKLVAATDKILKLVVLEKFPSPFYLKTARFFILDIANYRPLNSHGFTLCHTVSLSFSWSHGQIFISHDFAESM